MKRHACLCNWGETCGLECLRELELPPHMKIARDLEKYGSRIDVERIEATLAKLRAAEWDDAAWLAKFQAARQDDAAWLALFAEMLEMVDALKRVAAGRLQDWRDPAAVQNRKLAAIIDAEVAARAELKRQRGERNPIAQAREEIAKQYGHHSGEALRKWLRRARRAGGTKMSRDKRRRMP